jgi:hypothetical protein
VIDDGAAMRRAVRGYVIHSNADAADVGLPIYPGAVKKADKHDDSPGFSFGIWGASFGFIEAHGTD